MAPQSHSQGCGQRASQRGGVGAEERRAPTLNRPVIFICGKSVLSLGWWVKKAPFTVGVEVEDVVHILAGVGCPLSKEPQVQETKTQAHPRAT